MRPTKFNFNAIMIMVVVGSSMLFSCGEDEGMNGAQALEEVQWSIPEGSILTGAPKDAIPAIDKPKFISVDKVSTLSDDDLVVGFKYGDEVRAYPHEILDWHEIVNDDIDGEKLALTYCPLTGTAIGWNRVVDGQTTTFGVSGLLFNTNLMPYDRKSNSVWSQMLTAGVQGENIDRQAELMQIVEMPWGEWKKYYPQSDVLSRDTGFERTYDRYPYRNYREINTLLFPVQHRDERVFGKERVLGVIINGQAKLYRFGSMNDDGSMKVIRDEFQGQRIMVVGNNLLMTAFQVGGGQTTSDEISGISGAAEFTPLDNQLPAVFYDNIGNRYDLFGSVIDGPNKGEQLKGLESYMGFFFSFGAFYPNPEIYEF